MNENLVRATFSYKDLFLRKLSYSVTCSVISQLFILVLYVWFNNIDLLHPGQWLRSTFNTLTSFTTWLFLVPFLTIIFAQSIICAKDYVTKSTYCSTRFHKFISVFSIHNFVLLTLHVSVGGIMVWMLLSLGGRQYEYLATKCEENHCTHSASSYLILSGMFTGFYYYVKVYMSERNLNFPVIYQRKVLQLKAQIYPLLKNSVSNSFWPTLYYVFLHYFINLNAEEGNNTDVNGSSGILIYFYPWFFAALYYFSMNLMRFFFNLFLTEPIEFPLQKYHPGDLTLQDSIGSTNWPILQNLASLDLYLLSQWSETRRKNFFTLSQPGGHPYNWNNLTENILKLFTEYKNLLDKANDVPENSAKASPPVVPPNPYQSPIRYRNLRNMSYAQPEEFNLISVSQNPTPSINVSPTWMSTLNEKLKNAWNIFKVVTGINFLFGELPQVNVQKCLANGQVIIWASQGISNIVCASILEDPYGIVQKDLPAVITSLDSLKQSLDKLNKVTALSRKTVGSDDFNYKMKKAVTRAVKRSLYNICLTFGPFLNDLPVSKNIFQQYMPTK